ncbi:hypothetical protein CPB86DRAFT_722523 [Serendipita vermifera]|nr:hypothetical protein CPB86DRAFT_722523 [Serendipita vermifera]
MSAALSPEQQAAFDQLQVGISYDQWVWYQARRIDGRYLTHSVAALLIYDFFITLGEEIRYVWLTKPRFSFAKALWFLNRYIPLASVCIRIWAMAYMFPPKAVVILRYNSQHGPGWYVFKASPRLLFMTKHQVSVAVVDVLLMLRVWALYNGSRKVMWYLIAIFFIGFPAAIAIRQVPPIPSIPLVTAAPKTVTICKRSPPSELFSLYTMALAIETVIFAMVIYKAWGQQFKQSTPILTVLVRDGALYYAAITAVLAFMIAATMIPILYQAIADANLNVPLSSLACNRLILSLRGTYFKAGGGDAETLTSSHGMLGRPRKGSGYSRDIHLENIHVTSPSTSTPLRGLVSSDIRSQGGPTSPSTPGPARRHSKSRSLADMYNLHNQGGGGGTSPASPNSFVAKVTITQTKKVMDDDGYEYEVTSPKSAARARRTEGTKGIDWWDLYEESDRDRDLEQQGDIPRVYDTRVGYYHSGKEDEPSSSPEGSGVGRAS